MNEKNLFFEKSVLKIAEANFELNRGAKAFLPSFSAEKFVISEIA